MGIGDSVLQGLKDVAGANKKAVLEIADLNTSSVKVNKIKNSNTSAGRMGGINTNATGFSSAALQQFAGAMGVQVFGSGDQAFVSFKNYKKYRFECQFNPDELSISGYGGEELAVQGFRADQKSEDDGSQMATAKTHIEMQFKLIFDKTNIQDAFYIDKFTLSATNIGKGAATAAKKAITGQNYSVQNEVEALTAVVRDRKKTLARFTWGDMSYEGVINTVSAEYVMFNVNCEPIRAFVHIGMILYDETVDGAHSDIWIKEYLRDVYSLKDEGILGILDKQLVDVPTQSLPEGADALGEDIGEALGSLFSL